MTIIRAFSLLRTVAIATSIATLTLSQPNLGASAQETSAQDTRSYYGIGINITADKETHTVRVVDIAPNSPAASNNVKVGDELLAIDGKPVSTDKLALALNQMSGEVGTSVTLKFARKHKPYTVRLKRALITLSKERNQ